MCTKSQLDLILRELIKAYYKVYGDSVVRIVLYGSYARGDFDDSSDIDVVVIVKGSRAELQNKLESIWDISSDLDLEYGTLVSPTVIPYDEFEEYKRILPYYKNIEQEGVDVVA